jgi:hypothetical protein
MVVVVVAVEVVKVLLVAVEITERAVQFVLFGQAPAG